LLASGFTGGTMPVYSDKVRYFDGFSWYMAWYRTGGTPSWKGKLGSGQSADEPELEPGSGYVIQLLDGHAFEDDQWVYPPPASSKGAAAVVSRPSGEGERLVSRQKPRALGPSTNRSLDPERKVRMRNRRK
jgi:hypothetical protein